MKITEGETKLFYDLMAKETADQWYKEQILKPTVEEFVSLLPETCPACAHPKAHFELLGENY